MQNTPLTSYAVTYQVTLPVCIPNGEYLLRIQSLAIHNPYPAALPQVRHTCITLDEIQYFIDD